MKLLASFALATVALIAAASTASAAGCGNRPGKPAIPDGATASDDAMKATQPKIASYAKDMNTYLHCLADEIKGGKDEYDQVAADWKKQSDIFVKTPAK